MFCFLFSDFSVTSSSLALVQTDCGLRQLHAWNFLFQLEATQLELMHQRLLHSSALIQGFVQLRGCSCTDVFRMQFGLWLKCTCGLLMTFGEGFLKKFVWGYIAPGSN